MISVHCSYLSTEGERRFMPFGHPRGLPEAAGSWDAWRDSLPFVWQAVARSCMVLGDAARASFPGFAEDTCAR
jgi:hypothetical protein